MCDFRGIPATTWHSPSSAGTPLPPDLRRRLEAFFGDELSTVRVHEHPGLQRLRVRAFAAGEHIHVSPRAFDPQAGIGIDLLCHELTHVLQQRARRVDSADPSIELVVDSALEGEARMQEQRYLGGAGQALLANVEHRRIGSQARVLQPSWDKVDALWDVLRDYCKTTFSEKDQHVVRGEDITQKNTVVASGTIRYKRNEDDDDDEFIELPAFVSGNPMHRVKNLWKSTGLRAGEGHL